VLSSDHTIKCGGESHNTSRRQFGSEEMKEGMKIQAVTKIWTFVGRGKRS
jgi:hypothetical protein